MRDCKFMLENACSSKALIPLFCISINNLAFNTFGLSDLCIVFINNFAFYSLLKTLVLIFLSTTIIDVGYFKSNYKEASLSSSILWCWSGMWSFSTRPIQFLREQLFLFVKLWRILYSKYIYLRNYCWIFNRKN